VLFATAADEVAMRVVGRSRLAALATGDGKSLLSQVGAREVVR